MKGHEGEMGGGGGRYCPPLCGQAKRGMWMDKDKKQIFLMASDRVVSEAKINNNFNF